MKQLTEDLIGEIETALDRYTYEKYGSLELSDNVKQEIFNERKQFWEELKDKVEELDGTIDEILEDEPSDYDFYCQEDDRRRYLNVIGG